MKSAFAVLLFILSSYAFAGNTDLENLDQTKLGEILVKIPDALKKEITTKLSPSVLQREISFPINKLPFQITCKILYYDESPYPSSSYCSVKVDHTDRRLLHSGNEYRINVDEAKISRAIFEAIPYGKPKKKLYSWGRDWGTTFEGAAAEIFHYRWECSETSCDIRFSDHVIQD